MKAMEYLRKVLPSKYASMPMEPMRGGSGRVPIGLGDNLIAKVANMPRGITENEWALDGYLGGEGVIPHVEAADDLRDWIITERLRNAKGSRGLAYDLSNSISNSRGWESDSFREALERNKIGAFQNFGSPEYPSDFTSARHWRFRGDQPVMIDSGSYAQGMMDPWKREDLEPLIMRRQDAGVLTPRKSANILYNSRVLDSEPPYRNLGIPPTQQLGFARGGLARWVAHA